MVSGRLWRPSLDGVSCSREIAPIPLAISHARIHADGVCCSGVVKCMPARARRGQALSRQLRGRSESFESRQLEALSAHSSSLSAIQARARGRFSQKPREATDGWILHPAPMAAQK